MEMTAMDSTAGVSKVRGISRFMGVSYAGEKAAHAWHAGANGHPAKMVHARRRRCRSRSRGIKHQPRTGWRGWSRRLFVVGGRAHFAVGRLLRRTERVVGGDLAQHARRHLLARRDKDGR